MALIVAISPKGKNGPPPPPSKKKAALNAPPPPPGGNPSASNTPDPDPNGQTEPDADDKSISPQEVGYGENDLCQDCQNMGADGNCAKYGFPVTETGHCLAGYEPKNDQEPGQQAA